MTSLETRPFSASSSWNTPVSSNATFTKLGWPASTGYNYSVAWDSYSPSVYVASASDPLVQVTYPPGWGYPGGTVSVHMPAAANGAAGTDGELIVIDGDIAYNFWQFNRTSNTTASAASFGSENIVTGDGWGTKSPFLSAGITAAGASQLGGLLVKAETDDGVIDHALQLAVDFSLAKPGAVGQAISSDGSNASGIVQEGQLLAIPPGTPMPAGLSPLGQQVFKAMQTYGAYVIDVAGGTTNIRAQANAYDDATMTALWHDMGNITPLLQGVSNNSGSGSTGGTGGTVTDPPPVITNPPPVTTQPTTDTTKPTVQWVAANGPGVVNGTGTVKAGDTVRLTLKFSEAVDVSGTAILSLNDKGTAKYVSGTGTDTLQFDYKVAAGENTADLAISGYDLSGVKDKAGNAVDLNGAPTLPAGTLVVDTSTSTGTTTPKDTTAPTVQWIAATGAGITNGTGTVKAGDTVRLSVNFNEGVTVNGTPTLSLNTGGTAKYVGGAGTSTLQFDYVVKAGEKASDLAVAGYNLKGVTDLAGNAANAAGAPLQPAGVLAVGGSAAKVQWIAATGTELSNGTGTVKAGNTVRLSVNFNDVMTVSGTPTLSLNSGGTAKYVGGAGTSTLQFDYKVQAGEKASDLEVARYNLGGVKDRAGNAVDIAGAPHQPAGVLAVGATTASDPTAPKVQWIAASGSGISDGSGTVKAGDTVWLSVNFKDAMTVNGAPSLSLSSGGTAKYVSGSGTNTLQFKYVVGAGESAPDLEVSGYDLKGVTDRAGKSVNIAGAPHQPAGVLTIAADASAGTASVNPLAKTVASAASDLAPPATVTSGTSAQTASQQWFGGHGGSVTDAAFGSGRTLGYSGSQDGGASADPSQGSAMSKLALLNQYAASSFATPAPTSFGAMTQAWLNSSTQTLAKPRG
ncbi:hypothetical protein [Bosea sp. UNC402CLCol]|uniref:hypothetical protein n=1 Tax=Bosea sp. UNC402CLCol TaxID=1510531 RepID=UPI0012E0B62A|nr:hypothetical protein [Bosea sp. UNC402CLCol]